MLRPPQSAQPARWKTAFAAIRVAPLPLAPACRSTEAINKVTGTVFVSFIVNAGGSVSDAQVLKGIGSGCDEEPLRVVQHMPHWQAVAVRYALPIRFAR